MKAASVWAVHGELSKWKDLRLQLDSCNLDEQCLIDTLDGETNLKEALLALSDEVAEREALVDTMDARIKEIQERKSRTERVNETLRNIILQSMDIAGIKTISGALCTLSINEKGPAPKIDNEAIIPSDYWVAQDPVLDKKKINADVKDGVQIPGVTKTNGKISLTIRRK